MEQVLGLENILSEQEEAGVHLNINYLMMFWSYELF